MSTTAEQLRSKSENIIVGVKNMLKNLKQVNAESVMQIKANTEAVEHLKDKYEMDLAQIEADNAALNELIEKNDAFIQSVEKILLA